MFSAPAEDGIKYYDLATGNGELARPGKTVSVSRLPLMSCVQLVAHDGCLMSDSLQVHFDVKYKTLDVVSTRSARLLGGNRTVAEASPFWPSAKLTCPLDQLQTHDMRTSDLHDDIMTSKTPHRALP